MSPSGTQTQAMDIVRIEKRTLHFIIPTSTEAITSDTIQVINTTPDATPLAFKVKTTNQSRYIVRPNSGILPPHATQTIFIGLQPSETPPIGLSKDKFLVRFAALPPTATKDLPPDFWALHEASVLGIKLRVEFSSAPHAAVPKHPVPHANHLHGLLEARNLELARLRAELAETKAETNRVLKQAPVAPLSANKMLSDPFGGVSVAGFGLMLLLFLIVVNIILHIL